MTSGNVSVLRTELSGYEPELHALLRDYFAKANESGREWFDDEEFGAEISDAIAADFERLETASVDEPLFVALTNDQLSGTAQIKQLTETTVEFKRLYVRPEDRGQGLGRLLTERVIEETATDGFEMIRLGVAPYHTRAQSLYQSLGFEYTPPYEQTQAIPELHDEWNFMERPLSLDD